MKKLYFLLIAATTALLFAGCNNTAEMPEGPDQSTPEIQSAGNVFTPLAMMQQIADEVMNDGTRAAAPRLEATTLYVAFSPKNFAEFDQLLNRTDLDCSGSSIFDAPAADGLQPEKPADEIGKLYAFVKAGTILPANIDYEVLESYYNPYDDRSGEMTDKYAVQMIARATEANAQTRLVGEGGAKGYAQGTVKVMDGLLNKLVPLHGAPVTIVDFNTQNNQVYMETVYTSQSGQFKTARPDYQIGCTYRIDWKFGKYALKESRTVLAGTVSKFSTSNFDITFNSTDPVAYRYATAYRGLYAAVQTEMGSIGYNGVTGIICSGTNAPVTAPNGYEFLDKIAGTAVPEITIFCTPVTSSTGIIGTLGMALGYATQYLAMPSTLINPVYRHSWAMFTRLYLLKAEYGRTGVGGNIDPTTTVNGIEFSAPNEYNLQSWKYSETGESLKTPLFIDIYDANNQSTYFTFLNGSSGYPMDNICVTSFNDVKDIACRCKNITELESVLKSKAWLYNYSDFDVTMFVNSYRNL